MGWGESFRCFQGARPAWPGRLVWVLLRIRYLFASGYTGVFVGRVKGRGMGWVIGGRGGGLCRSLLVDVFQVVASSFWMLVKSICTNRGRARLLPR